MRRLLALAVLFAQPVAAETVAIVNARTWTMTASKPVEDATIVIEDGRVTSIASGTAAPTGARIIDAGGRTVTPALFGAVTQLGLVAVSGADDTDDRRLTGGPIGAAFDVRLAINSNDLAIEEARAAGMTQAIVVPSGSAGAPFDGQAALVRLSGPGGVTVGDPVAIVATISGAATGNGGSRAAAWQVLRNALNEAARYRRRRPDGRPRDQLLNRVDVEALVPVVEGRLPLMLRVHRESDIRQALRLAGEYRVRVIIAGGSEAWRAAPALAAAGVPVILDPLADLPMSYDETGARPDNAAILSRAGVEIAFSVSAQGIYLVYSPGQAIRQGAGVAVANGMDEAAALRAITAGPATIWGRGDTAGTIAPGRLADLVIWDGDPIEPSTAPRLVLAQGVETSLVTRQTRLRDRYRPGAAAVGQ